MGPSRSGSRHLDLAPSLSYLLAVIEECLNINPSVPLPYVRWYMGLFRGDHDPALVCSFLQLHLTHGAWIVASMSEVLLGTSLRGTPEAWSAEADITRAQNDNPFSETV